MPQSRHLIFALLTVLFSLRACGVPNLKKVDLEPLLLQAGDLPPAVIGTHVSHTAPSTFDSLPKPTRARYQQLERSGQPIGSVTLLLYNSKDDVEEAFDSIVEGMVDQTVQSAPVGERAKAATMVLIEPRHHVVFERCKAVVDIRLSGADRSHVEGYARRLDTWLQSVVC